jgi:tetratricopeptide (TPR) repeat protein
MTRLAPITIAAACLARAAAGADTVVVLPFFNLSNSANLDWIGESVGETVREALVTQGVLALGRDEREEALRRLSIRPSALRTRASVVKVGSSLDAGQVVFGQFSLNDGSLQITARVLDLKRIRQGPELNELGALEDLASIQNHLAWQAVKALAPQSAPGYEEFRRTRPLLRVDAIENYIRGLMANSPEQKHRFFTQAARLDERFSQPCFELGRLHTARKDYRVALGWFERVSPSDSRYYEAQFLLGVCRFHTGDYAGAETAFRLVAESVPLSEVFNNLGVAQSRQNKPETVVNFRKALDGDEADPDYHFNLAYALWKSGEHEAAASGFRAALERKPGDPAATLMLGKCLNKSAPKPGEAGMERLKLNYEETAYRQLKAELGGAR